MNILIFDIETIPDVETGRKLLSLKDLSDEEVAMAMLQMRRQEVEHDFLPHYLQRIVAISAVIRQSDSTRNKFKVWSLGETSSSESELIQRFFERLRTTWQTANSPVESLKNPMRHRQLKVHPSYPEYRSIECPQSCCLSLSARILHQD